MFAQKEKILTITEGDVVTYDDEHNLNIIWNTPNSTSDKGMGPKPHWDPIYSDIYDEEGDIDYKKVEMNLFNDLKKSLKSQDCDFLSLVSEAKRELFEEEVDFLNKLYVTISLHVAPTHDYQLMYQCAMGQIKCSVRFKTEIEVFNSVATALVLIQYMTGVKLEDLEQEIIDHCAIKLKPFHLDYLDSLFQLKRKWHIQYQRDGWGEQIWVNEYIGHLKKSIRWLSEVRVRGEPPNSTVASVPGAVVDFSTAIDLVEALLIDAGIVKATKEMPAEFMTLIFLGCVGIPPNSASLLDLCVGYISEGFNPKDPKEILVSVYCCVLVIKWSYKHLRLLDKPRWFEDFICLTTEAFLCRKWLYYEINYFDEFRTVYIPQTVAEKGRTARCLKLMPFKMTLEQDPELTFYRTMRQTSNSKKGFVFLGSKKTPDEESGILQTFQDSGFQKVLKDNVLFSFLRVASLRKFNVHIPKRTRATISFRDAISNLMAYV